VIAGSRAGLKTLLIPKGESFFSNESERAAIENATKGKVDIVEIYTLDEAMERFTGKKRERKSAIPISEEYLSTMKVLARELCGRTKELGESALPGSVSSADRGDADYGHRLRADHGGCHRQRQRHYGNRKRQEKLGRGLLERRNLCRRTGNI